MGPFILMDKSTIQGLNLDEFPYLGRYYYHVISPILLRELASMLAKSDGDTEALQKKVSVLAAKVKYGTVQLVPSADKMAYNNLLGVFVPMDGRVPIEGGTLCLAKDGSKGYVFDESPEVEMLRKWSEGHFQEIDIERGREIRKIDTEVDLANLCKSIAEDLAHLPRFKSLVELIHWIDNVHFAYLDPEQLLLSAANFILEPRHIKLMLDMWNAKGRPTLKRFAPYSFYFYRVNLFYILGIYFDLIKKGKQSKTHLDIQYIYYLPFSMIFTSGDKEMIKIAFFFLRKDQEMISLTELKNDFNLMNSFFNELSEKELEEFNLEYGPYPPDLSECHTSQIWQKRMRPRPLKAGARPSPEEEKMILEKLKQFKEALPVKPDKDIDLAP